MRQIMPHRNNIGPRCLKCKKFLSESIEMRGSATFLPQRRKSRTDEDVKFLMLNNGLYMLQMFSRCVAPLFEHS